MTALWQTGFRKCLKIIEYALGKKKSVSNSVLLFFLIPCQSDLQESKKRMDEMEAELQRANNKLCNTGHLLSQLTIKVNGTSGLKSAVIYCIIFFFFF